MSLKNPEEDFDGIVDEKPSFSGKIFKKIKIPLIILLVGLLVGGLLTHEYVEPLLKNTQGENQTSCARTNELLSKENSCLYTLLSDPKTDTNKCSTTQINPAT